MQLFWEKKDSKSTIDCFFYVYLTESSMAYVLLFNEPVELDRKHNLKNIRIYPECCLEI